MGIDLGRERVPDGTTLLMAHINSQAIAPALFPKMPYHAERDFAPIALVGVTPNLLVCGPQQTARTVKDLVELCRKNPGKISFGSAGSGSAQHLALEMFKLAAGIDATHVPYKGAPEAINNVLSGSVQFCFSPVLVAAGQVKAGKLLALAVSTAKRSPMFPDVPTVAEAALPGFDYDQWYGLLASAQTPRPIVRTVNKEVVRILNLGDIKERMLTQGATPSPTTPPLERVHRRRRASTRTGSGRGPGARQRKRRGLRKQRRRGHGRGLRAWSLWPGNQNPRLTERAQ